MTVNIVDTLIIKDTAISAGLITANSWKLELLRGVVGNTIYFYERGGVNNTLNFDIEYISFRQDKTGIYFDANGATHQITWDFINDQKTALTFTVLNAPPNVSQVVIWDEMKYKNGQILYNEYWSMPLVYGQPVTNAHSEGIRSPR